MTRQSFQTLAIIAFWILVLAYVVACAFQTVENLELLGAGMLFAPNFKQDPNRITVKCRFIRPSSTLVTTPEGATFPTAYHVVIGSTAVWIPHSLCARVHRLHGDRTYITAPNVPFFSGNPIGVTEDIEVPRWFLKKELGSSYESESADLVERQTFLKKWINKRPRRRWAR